MPDSLPQRTLLPHALAVLYGLAIAFASLQPFAPWIDPVAGTPFWLFASWPLRFTRFDVIANVIAYVPFGIFVALVPRRASPMRRVLLALATGALLSFVLESLQMFLPLRVASVIDLVCNAAGALLGGFAGASLVRAERTRRRLSGLRHRIFMGGRLGDLGVALLALWLVAQTNPGIPLFALTIEPEAVQGVPLVIEPYKVDLAEILLEAAASALQLIGVGLFLAVLLRERRYIGGAVLVLVGAALLAKGFTAMLVLRPAVWATWLKPGVSIGMAAGLLVLLCTAFLPRPVQVATCATALLASLLLPLLTADVPPLHASATIFGWRYGHLLNFNGLTQSVLLVWPLAAAGWLFVLAGLPAWGAPRR